MIPHLILSCAGALFAMPITAVIEVVRMVAPAMQLPRAPRYCLGAIDYHGQFAPLFDLGARLGLCPPRQLGELVDGRLVLVRGRDHLISYAVDDVVELTDRPVEPLSSDGRPFAGLISGALHLSEGRTALLLDLRHGALVPVVASERLRRSLAELQNTLRPISSTSVPPLLAAHPTDLKEGD